MNETKLSTIMTQNPVTVAGNTSFDEALGIMGERGIRHLPVLEDGKLLGVISDRDLLEETGWLPSEKHDPRGPGGGERTPRHVADVMRRSVVEIGPDESIVAATVELLGRAIGCLPIMKDGALVGMLTETDLLAAYANERIDDQNHERPDPSVSVCMTSDPTTIEAETSLAEAISICRANDVRHLPVLESGRLMGIVSDRDLRRATGAGRHDGMPISEIATREPVTVAMDTSMSQAAKIMSTHKFSSLPVVDNGVIVGILTISDVLEHRLQSYEGGVGTTGR